MSSRGRIRDDAMFEDLWRKSSLVLNMLRYTLNTRLIKHLRNDTPSADPVIRLVQPTTVVVVLRGAQRTVQQFVSNVVWNQSPEV
jgi:hypothetical protein